jgi:hypothetical protein
VYDDKAKNVNGKKPRHKPGAEVFGRLTIGYGTTDKNTINEIINKGNTSKTDITELQASQLMKNYIDIHPNMTHLRSQEFWNNLS